jgi:hypothetical protein
MNATDPDHSDPAHINDVVNQLALASDPSELRTLLEEHPEVLTDQIERALAATVENLAAIGDSQVLVMARSVAHLVSSCRIVGVDAFTCALEQAVTGGSGQVDTEALYQSVLDLLDNYRRTGDMENLTQLQDAVALAYIVVPVDSFQAMFSEAMGVALRRHFLNTGDEIALERAVRALRRAVADADESSPARTSHLTSLGNALRTSASHMASPELFEESVAVQRAALDLASPDDSPCVAANLGAALIELFTATQDVAVLNEAVEVLRKESRRPVQDPRLGPLLRANLALALSHRFDRTRNLADLTDAIDEASDAVATAPVHDGQTAGLCKQLAADLRQRYEVLGDDTDLESSIALLRGLLSAPADAAVAVAVQAELARALDARYRRAGQREDLHEARELYEAAVASSEGDEIRHAEYLNGLALAHRTQFETSDEHDADAAILDRAIECFDLAIETLVTHSRPVHLLQGNLAMALTVRYRLRRDNPDPGEGNRAREHRPA